MIGLSSRERLFLPLLLLPCLAFAQPASITLKAKIRDIKESPAGDPGKHPDFENQDFFNCGVGINPGYVEQAIGTGDDPSADFEGDERGPVLKSLTLPADPTRECYTSFERFKEWYNDRPAWNRRFAFDMVLTRNAQGLYVYDNDKFFPLDVGQPFTKFVPTDPDPYGMRTQVETHNYGFTLELHTSFTYRAGQGQVFSFKGDDDVWVFINGKLVIDLGGLRNQTTDQVALDTEAAALGLVDGRSYPLDFFFAERYAYGSHLRITTSLLLGDPLPVLPTPAAAPAGHTFSNPVSVALSVPGHPDAVIRYTTDGSEPTASSPAYSAAAPIAISQTTVLKAKGFKAGFEPSATMTETYTRQLDKLPTPVASPPGGPFKISVSVSLSVPGRPDATIRYTLDGTEPTDTSPLYSGPIAITANTTVRAKAFASGALPSDASNDVYVREWETLPTPVADPKSGSFLKGIAVSLAVPGHPDAVIRYTLDGSEPSETSPAYAGPIPIAQTTTLKARAYKPEWLPSAVLTETYTLPNVISITMDSAVTVSDPIAVVYTDAIEKTPIVAVTPGPGPGQCLTCPPGTSEVYLQPGARPQWTVTSKYPFHYVFHIYDHFGQFVTKMKGRIDQATLDRVAADPEGNHVLLFRWVAVAKGGREAGTGAYILRGVVTSDKSDSPRLLRKAESTILKTFGYVKSR